MRAQFAGDKYDVLDGVQQCNATFDLVRNLLTGTMAEFRREVVVKADRESFYYDPDARVDTEGLISAVIRDAEVVEEETRTEVTISGAIQSSAGTGKQFSLYFVMDRRSSPAAREQTCLEKLVGSTVPVWLQQNSNSLYDSLFKLTFCIDHGFGECGRLGEGRGFFLMSSLEKYETLGNDI